MYLAHALVPIILGSSLVAADNKNYFTSPVSNTAARPSFTLGDQVQVSWVTELGEFNVTFWQESLVQESAASQGNIYSKIHASDQVTNFTWTVQLLGFDLSYSNQFFLWVNPDGPDGFVSTYFNITEPTTTTTTAMTATATTINTSNLATQLPSTGTEAVAVATRFCELYCLGRLNNHKQNRTWRRRRCWSSDHLCSWDPSLSETSTR
ncbi:hypothetical protein N7466_001330 [Penicillium verhagenii]|uniref:uncharacterized protein n=1 Tax=Penicillium verhagenii TaxID=1562060 RepID=UPI0025455427|nr:uncharacterized protein N7466_001330 [Penicillium verhagenii]KAJ5948315.1 hypothetical protein N7466_001330 [Penicillium verhagenii]